MQRPARRSRHFAQAATPEIQCSAGFTFEKSGKYDEALRYYDEALKYGTYGSLESVINRSINQTLSRTSMTKVTTSIVVVALLLLGGEALRGFSEALLIGIAVGTYSSIYISSSIALSCGLKAEHVFPPVHKDPIDELP